jgi:ubiquinone/menaquinone biosynthesis C-methylase UbiE
MLDFDEETSRRVEAMYTTPDVQEQRRAVVAALALGEGDRVVDVGVGPGFLAAEMAEVVGRSGLVCGVDVSASMLALAAGRATPPGSAPIELHEAAATAIPHPDGSFDAAVSTQVFEYLPDVPAALVELRRLLRPGGRVVLLDTDWDSIVWHTRDRVRMAQVLAVWEEHLADAGLPRTLTASLRQAGFTVATPRVLPLLDVGYDPGTFSGGLLELVVRFVAGRGGITAVEAEDWAAELRALGPDYFFSLNRYLFTATAGA